MSTQNLFFGAEIRAMMYTPVNPSFTIYKWGLRGSTLYRHVFVMSLKLSLAVWFCSLFKLIHKLVQRVAHFILYDL